MPHPNKVDECVICIYLTPILSLILLQAHSVFVKIKEIPILDRLSFEVNSGSLVGILGPNGSGKTTLIRAISGTLPFNGNLTFKKKPLSSWNRRQLAAQIAVVQQNQRIYFDFTVLDFVLLGRLPHKGWLEHVSHRDREIVDTILAHLKLESLKNRLITNLSGGERQRVLLAQALSQAPELLLLDEPTANLDIYYQLAFLNQIRTLVENGLTVLAVFHDLGLALKYADQILVLKNGHQVAFGPTKTVITPKLIQDVFLVESAIVQDANDYTHIQYLNTL